MKGNKSLSSALVRDGVVAPYDMAAAIEHQAMHRITLDTALIELRMLDEARAKAYIAEVTGFDEAPEALLLAASPDAATFPQEWAEKLGVAPCRLGERGVEVITARPISQPRIKKLKDLMGVPLVLYAAPEFRVREVRAHVYRAELPSAERALVARLGAIGFEGQSKHDGSSLVLATVEDRLNRASRREQILQILRGFLTSRFLHGQVFLVSRGVVTPAGERAPRILLDEPSVLTNVASAGIPFRGPVPRGNHALFKLFGRPVPREVSVVPIVVGSRVVCVLWGDQGSEPLGESAEELERMALVAERSLVRLLKRQRQQQK